MAYQAICGENPLYSEKDSASDREASLFDAVFVLEHHIGAAKEAVLSIPVHHRDAIAPVQPLAGRTRKGVAERNTPDPQRNHRAGVNRTGTSCVFALHVLLLLRFIRVVDCYGVKTIFTLLYLL